MPGHEVATQTARRERETTRLPAAAVRGAGGCAFLASLLSVPAPAQAGPPYVTDDPEPVPYRHWEFYLASQHELTSDGATGTAPLLEVNYGAAPGVQLHVLAPLAYARPSGGPTRFGPGDIELGAKLRFVQEGEHAPMVGIFAMLELPTGNAGRGLGTGRLHAFLPLWLQKSYGAWTTYGGVGYWLNPGTGNRNYWFAGWQVQRRLGALATPGVEIFYTTADRSDGRSSLRFNLGLVLDLAEQHHILASGGTSIVGEKALQGYLAYQLTL